MEFDFSLIIHSIPLLLRGAGLTLEITALAVGLGLLIGLVASPVSYTHLTLPTIA